VTYKYQLVIVSIEEPHVGLSFPFRTAAEATERYHSLAEARKRNDINKDNARHYLIHVETGVLERLDG